MIGQCVVLYGLCGEAGDEFLLRELIEREAGARWHEVVFDYYANFIPYFSNMFSPLFCLHSP